MVDGKQIFVTGTDTGVGKTVVAAIMTAGLAAYYWKPVQCGLQEKTDTEFVQEITGLPGHHFCRETYRLSQPLSPHAAAVKDQVRIDLDSFHFPEESLGHSLIVEGAGGIMVPLNQKEFMIDLIKKLNMPVLLVGRSTLGTINHTLLSLDKLRSCDLEVLGVVMNGPKNRGNRDALEKYGKVTVLAEIEPILDINSADLAAIYQESFFLP